MKTISTTNSSVIVPSGHYDAAALCSEIAARRASIAQFTDSAMPRGEMPPAGQHAMGLRCGTLPQHFNDSAMPYSEIPPAGQDDMGLRCGTANHLTDSTMLWQRGCSTTRHRQPGKCPVMVSEANHLTDSAMPWQHGCSTTRHRQPGKCPVMVSEANHLTDSTVLWQRDPSRRSGGHGTSLRHNPSSSTRKMPCHGE
jgi:hypothetical protein